jgi:cation transporter-like permease
VSYLVPLVVATIGALGSIAAAYIAHKAHKNTKPISNGFAPETIQRLVRIEDLIVDHIADHAQSDVRRKG